MKIKPITVHLSYMHGNLHKKYMRKVLPFRIMNRHTWHVSVHGETAIFPQKTYFHQYNRHALTVDVYMTKKQNTHTVGLCPPRWLSFGYWRALG